MTEERNSWNSALFKLSNHLTQGPEYDQFSDGPFTVQAVPTLAIQISGTKQSSVTPHLSLFELIVQTLTMLT